MQQSEEVDLSKSEADEFYIKYEAKDILGKGLSSTVRRVVEKRTGREFAAKIIDLSTENNSDAQAADLRTAAKREVALLLKLQGHPNIIELHEVFETSTFIFLVFEICKRGELFDYLTQYVRLSERRTRDFMRQLFDALSYIHERQCVHRDVKPG